MNELINTRWRAYVQSNILASDLHDELAKIDWEDGEDRWWCVEMALDASGVPQVMENHGICTEDQQPEPREGYVAIACSVDEDTEKQELLGFDAAEDADWEDEWEDDEDDDDDDE